MKRMAPKEGLLCARADRRSMEVVSILDGTMEEEKLIERIVDGGIS